MAAFFFIRSSLTFTKKKSILKILTFSCATINLKDNYLSLYPFLHPSHFPTNLFSQ